METINGGRKRWCSINIPLMRAEPTKKARSNFTWNNSGMDRGANKETPTAQILEHWILIDLFVSPFPQREHLCLFPVCSPADASQGAVFYFSRRISKCSRLLQGFLCTDVLPPHQFSPFSTGSSSPLSFSSWKTQRDCWDDPRDSSRKYSLASERPLWATLSFRKDWNSG